MSRAKNLSADPKITTTHQTVIDGAVPVLDRLRKLKTVSKIVIGPIAANRSRTPRIKCLPLRLPDGRQGAGLIVKVQGTGAVQQFWVYTSDPDSVKEHLTASPR
ncbi:MAG: hypothetical protein WD049_06425 [Candidatus Paceibacterota bacterium]